MARLIVSDHYHVGKYRLYWEEDGEYGGWLCQDPNDGAGEAPQESDDPEHWRASKAVREAPGVLFDSFGAYWETLSTARGALKLARAALKAEKPLPDWAKQALAAGWKAPKGWKP